MLNTSAYCSASYMDITMSGQWFPPAPGPSYNFISVTSTAPSNSRELRNIAEKNRRDKINILIGEIAKLVPMVSRSAKRMDKISILRLAVTYLRIYQTLLNNKSQNCEILPKYVDQFILEQLVCDQMGGFLLILTPNGKIVFISHTIENLLGHLQTDLMGQSLFNITNPEDHDRLRMFLKSEGDMELHWKKYFNIRIKRAGPRTESPVYELVSMEGMHRQILTNDSNGSASSTSSSTSSSAGTTRALTPTFTLNNEIFLFLVKVCRPEPLTDRLIEAAKDEYVTRHLIDGTIVDSDHRISVVAGYMIDEVSGVSAFKYMHRDDVRWVMIALRQMYDRGDSRGSSCYRLVSRNGQFIYLRTSGFLEIDDQGTVESFVCVNSLVSEKEGIKLISEMKKKFSALISQSVNGALLTPPPSTGDIDLVEDPTQVDQALRVLVKDLPSPGSDHRSIPSPQVHCNESQDCSSSTDSSPCKPYHVRVKTATKRPPSTDVNLNNKRHKVSQSPMPLNCLSPPYPKRPHVADSTQPDQPAYQQLSNNA